MRENLLLKNREERKKTEIKRDFDSFQKILGILKEMGFDVITDITIELLEDPSSESGFPIVRDGIDGIRIYYVRKEGLKIGFTNLFDHSSKDSRIQEFRDKLSGDNNLKRFLPNENS
jgi:hypothetical protein